MVISPALPRPLPDPVHHRLMKTLLQFIYEHEKNLADRIWLTQPMGNGVLQTFTWTQAIGEARRMATFLRDRGYPPGSRIAILSKNCAWWFMADLAIWMAGYVSVPVYPTLTAESVRAILEHSEARLVFVGKLDQFDAMKPGIPASLDRIAFPISPPNAGDAWNDIVARTAGAAQPTGDQRMRDHLVTHGDVGDRVADGVHPPGVLVTYRVRQLNAGLLLPLSFQDVNIGAAHPRTADLHNDVQRAFDGRRWYVAELQLGVVSDDLHGFHQRSLVLVLVNCIT